jgi:phosphoserine phosphatase
VNGWLRLYDQIIDLIHAAQTRGYDVWIITASPQNVVAALSSMVGIDQNRVIGIRQLTDHGRLTYHIEGCGPVADGEDSMITYVEGKRCWINKVVFGDTSAHAIERRPDQRQVFAASDSDTDVEFVRDATYKLALNRQKPELMCRAYLNEGNSWRINPCSTTACFSDTGAAVPCLDESGHVIPDQLDTVHP